MGSKLWEGRFAEQTDKRVEAFTASIDIDKRLYLQDIAGSIAHSKMLAKCGIISDDEALQLIQGLGVIQREIEHGQFRFDDSLEDIHMHIESRLRDEVGKVAAKLHTARSRNDQVALDIRLYLREAISFLVVRIDGLRKVIIESAKTHIDVVMPGYTHLQRAQPVLLAHHLMAYYEMLSRDRARLIDCRKRVNVMPLGTAALAGTTYPIDRAYTAELLDFPEVSANSIDSVSDRDFIVEFLAAASICMVHLSRLSEELILWSSAEFGFVDLPDAFATGSSIMPQKKNPDVAELVRGKSGGVFGDLVALLTLMKSLPLSYNRDMQEDKKPLFNTIDTLAACLDMYTGLIPKLTVRADKMRTAASKGYLNATDLADYLVTRGMAFRDAHHCTGQAVAHALAQAKELHELSLEELKRFSALIEEDIFDVLAVEQIVNRRQSFGGTATETVNAAIAAAEKNLTSEIEEMEKP